MPELPEIETVKLGLQKYVVGHTINTVEVLLKKQFLGKPETIIGAKIIAIERLGKGLIINLSNNFSLAIHFKMTGQLIYRDIKITNKDGVEQAPNKFTRLIFTLDRNAKLFYNDLRQFGWIKIIPTDKVKNLSFFKELGPEFLKDLSLEKFRQILDKTKTPIKILIMDQKKMAGVGNIYANDALCKAKINPQKPANLLNNEETKRLFMAINNVLENGIKNNGASETNFVNILGEKGNYQNKTLIYNKNGQKCESCKNIILKTMLGGRGTYYCPNCQK